MQKYVRQATPEDAHKLAPKIRKADREEIKASHNSTPLNALLHPFTQLQHKTFSIIGTEEEDVIGMFGVVPCETKDYGIAWLLSSDLSIDLICLFNEFSSLENAGNCFETFL